MIMLKAKAKLVEKQREQLKEAKLAKKQDLEQKRQKLLTE